MPNHKAGLDKVMELLMGAEGPVRNAADIKCVGHRVVHGGEKFTAATIIDAGVKAGTVFVYEICIRILFQVF